MKIIYGTGNKNKVKDIKEIIKAHGKDWEVQSLKDIEFNEEIEESGETFEENSKIKSLAVREYCAKNNVEYDIIITDDAGCCVDCLNGDPGVYSARFAGPNATQEQCINKLLKMIEETGDLERKAKFVCVLTSYFKDGTEIVSRGECLGTIAKEAKKLGGLTYSPIFIPNGYDVPMSELSAEDYAKVHNHREVAFSKLLNDIKI